MSSEGHPSLESPLEINEVAIRNRLYRAPLLECAGNGPDAVERLIAALEPAAESGAGLIFQGATIVRENGGCAAPGMTRVHDPAFLARCERLTARINDHGTRLFIQLEHGGLRSLETWHATYRERHPDLRQLAVSKPPWQLRILDRLGLLSFDVKVLSNEEIYELIGDFGAAAEAAIDAGYDGIHLAGANMGIIEQFSSPLYNRRDDEFGEAHDGPRPQFLKAVYEEIRSRVDPSVPIVTKVPAESAAPWLVRRRLTLDDGVELAAACADIGYDALVPVVGSGFWDGSIIRGEYPARAWRSDQFCDGYDRAFGGAMRRRLVSIGNRIQAAQLGFSPAWNQEFCRQVRERVEIPVLAEGGIRSRNQIDTLLSNGTCDMVGLGRPFYAEPRLPARLLRADEATVICSNCNNCTVPQVTGADGMCRTPSVLERHGQLVADGAYEQ